MPWRARVVAISASQPRQTDTEPESTTAIRRGSTDSAALRATSYVPLSFAARFTLTTASCCFSCSRKADSKAARLGAPVRGRVLLVRNRR